MMMTLGLHVLKPSVVHYIPQQSTPWFSSKIDPYYNKNMWCYVLQDININTFAQRYFLASGTFAFFIQR